ncbi:phosphonate C-P lyase system protein PhnH [Thalassovita mangrovi]|uniref:Phosphonate C-P lyase system protein PhnH n=1 Tax=Thalassovita mangrovi TaxID=2692236 RepID=A0A6L8LMC4_9RHOB|nr:phosphonate C-P lyase system protein PhnH [Thalassovita mangrovi]MYM57197.1 phosphonate C-P lyase system protein PhnH [Thalassovita mangrovi]
MLTTPVPNPDETLANRAFDALLWALSRPGLPRDLPTAGETAIIAALIDRECRVFSADPALIPLLAETGAEIADLPQADHVFLGALGSLAPLSQLGLGSDLYPDDGATAVIRVNLGSGDRLRLTGPGVDGALDLQIGGLPGGFWQARRERIRYPMGFDLILIDGTRVVGIPRSTSVEVL